MCLVFFCCTLRLCLMECVLVIFVILTNIYLALVLPLPSFHLFYPFYLCTAIWSCIHYSGLNNNQKIPVTLNALTTAGLAIRIEDVAFLAPTDVGRGNSHTVVLAAVVPQVTEINFWGNGKLFQCHTHPVTTPGNATIILSICSKYRHLRVSTVMQKGKPHFNQQRTPKSVLRETLVEVKICEPKAGRIKRSFLSFWFDEMYGTPPQHLSSCCSDCKSTPPPGNLLHLNFWFSVFHQRRKRNLFQLWVDERHLQENCWAERLR